MYIYMLSRIRQGMLKTYYKQNNKTILEIFLFWSLYCWMGGVSYGHDQVWESFGLKSS